MIHTSTSPLNASLSSPTESQITGCVGLDSNNNNNKNTNDGVVQIPEPKRRKLSSHSYVQTGGDCQEFNTQFDSNPDQSTAHTFTDELLQKQQQAEGGAVSIRPIQNVSSQTNTTTTDTNYVATENGWKILCVYSTSACIRHWQWTTDVLQRGQVLHNNDTRAQWESHTKPDQDDRRHSRGGYVVQDYQTGRTYPMKTPSLISNFMDTLGVRSDVGRVDALYTARPYIDPENAAARTSCCIRLEVVAYVMYIQRNMVHDILVSGAAGSFIKWFIQYVRSGNIGLDCEHALTQWQIDSNTKDHHQQNGHLSNNIYTTPITEPTRFMKNDMMTKELTHLTTTQVESVARMRLRDEQLRMRTFFIQPSVIGRFVPLSSCDVAIDLHRNAVVPMSSAIHDVVCSPRIVLRPSASFLTGRAGVGKTRVSLSMCRQTQNDPVRVSGDPVLMISQATLIFVRASVLDYWIQEARIVGFTDDEITVIASAVDWKNIGSATHLMRPGIVLVTHEFAFDNGHYYTTLLQMVSQQNDRGIRNNHNSRTTSNNNSRTTRSTNDPDSILQGEPAGLSSILSEQPVASSSVFASRRNNNIINNNVHDNTIETPTLTNVVFLEQTILKTHSFRRPSHQIKQFSFASYFWNRIIVDDAEIRGSADDYLRLSCGSLWMILTRDTDLVEDQLSVPPTELAESVFGLASQLIGSNLGNNNNDMFSLHQSVWHSVFKAASIIVPPPSHSYQNNNSINNQKHSDSLVASSLLSPQNRYLSHDAEVHVHWVDLHPVEATILDKCLLLTDEDDYDSRDAELYHIMHAAIVPDIYQWWPRRDMIRWWANAAPQSPRHIAAQLNLQYRRDINNNLTMDLESLSACGSDNTTTTTVSNDDIAEIHNQCFHHNNTDDEVVEYENCSLSDIDMLSELSDYYDDSTDSETDDDERSNNRSSLGHSSEYFRNVLKSLCEYQDVSPNLNTLQEKRPPTLTPTSSLSWTCPVCIDSPSDVLMRCGHMLCMQCIRSHLTHTKANPPQCPMCKTTFKSKSLYHIRIPNHNNYQITHALPATVPVIDDTHHDITGGQTILSSSHVIESSKLRATAQLIKSLINIRGLKWCRIMICCMWASGLRRLQKLLYKLQNQGHLPHDMGRIAILEDHVHESLTTASTIRNSSAHSQIVQDFTRTSISSSSSFTDSTASPDASCVQILMVPRNYQRGEDILLGLHIDPNVVTDVIFLHPPTGSLFEIPHHLSLQTCFQTGVVHNNNTHNIHAPLSSSLGPFAPAHHHDQKRNDTHKVNIHYIIADHSIERTCVEGLAANASGYFAFPLIHHHTLL